MKFFFTYVIYLTVLSYICVRQVDNILQEFIMFLIKVYWIKDYSRHFQKHWFYSIARPLLSHSLFVQPLLTSFPFITLPYFIHFIPFQRDNNVIDNIPLIKEIKKKLN